MARISLDPPNSLVYRFGKAYARRRFGGSLDPLEAMAHNPKVLRTNSRSEMSLAKWSALPSDLKHLAEMSASVTIGCSWCVDFGWWVMASEGVAAEKIRDVPRWRESDAYTELERRVIEYAEAASQTPPAVTDEMVAGLRETLTDEQLVELTMMIAVENQRSRFNSALGLTSQGFKDKCDVPA